MSEHMTAGATRPRPNDRDRARRDELGADAAPADSENLAMDDVEGATVGGRALDVDEWTGESAGDDLF